MTYFRFLTFVLLLVGLSAHAQDSLQDNSLSKKQAVLSRLTHELSLTTDQRAQLSELLDGRNEKLKDWEKLQQGNNKSVLRKKIRTESLSKLSTILTPDQMDLYMSNRARRKKQREKAYKGRPMPKRDEILDF